MNLKTILALTGAAAILLALLYVRGLSADRDRWRTAAGQWKGHAVAWEGHARGVAKLRRDEGQQARSAVQAAGKQCDARVAAARKSAGAIRTIITKEPTRDAQNCPVRERIDPGLLRDALRPGG